MDGEIRSIQHNHLALLTSGQVLLDLQSAVKELVENSLDAGATNIEIKFKDHGAESFEVIDNGSGIDPKNYHGLALKHHTSKLSTFSDLSTVKTFGFRGEALSSLCALSNVEILTSTSSQEPIGTILCYNSLGKLVSSSGKNARKRGTTITISNLFHNLPVRRKEFLKNIKKEFQKCLNLLNCYALISKGVRWNVCNILTKSGNKKIVNLNLTSSKSERDWLNQNVINLFGVKISQNLLKFELELKIEQDRKLGKGDTSLRKRIQKEKENRELKEKKKKHSVDSQDDDDGDGPISDEGNGDNEDEEAAEESNPDSEGDPSRPPIKVSGLISLPTLPNGSSNSRSSSDRQFLYLNGRPWDSNKVMKAFNEVFRSFTNSNSKDSSGFPFLIADFQLPGDSYDVNVSPDKRTLFVHRESQLVEALKNSLEELFAPTRSTFAVGGASKPKKQAQSSLSISSSSASISQSKDIRNERSSNSNSISHLNHSKLNFQPLERVNGNNEEEEEEEADFQILGNEKEMENIDEEEDEVEGEVEMATEMEMQKDKGLEEFQQDSEMRERPSEFSHSSQRKPESNSETDKRDSSDEIGNEMDSSESFHSTFSTSRINKEKGDGKRGGEAEDGEDVDVKVSEEAWELEEVENSSRKGKGKASEIDLHEEREKTRNRIQDKEMEEEEEEEVTIDTTKASWSPLKRKESSNSDSNPSADFSSSSNSHASMKSKLDAAFKTPTLIDPSRKAGTSTSAPAEKASRQVPDNKLVRGKVHPDLAEILSSFSNSRLKSSQFESRERNDGSRRKRARIQAEEDDDEDLDARRERIEKEKKDMRERLRTGREDDSEEELMEEDQGDPVAQDDDKEASEEEENEETSESREAHLVKSHLREKQKSDCCSHYGKEDEGEEKSEAEGQEIESGKVSKAGRNRTPLDPSSDEIEDPIAVDEREHNLAALDDASSDESQDESKDPTSNHRSEFPGLQSDPNPNGNHLPSIPIDLTRLSKKISLRRNRLEKENQRRETLLMEKELQEKLILEAENTCQAGFQNRDSESVENVLNRIIRKEDFFKMKISGQFNLGFIIVRRRVRADLKNPRLHSEFDRDLQQGEVGLEENDSEGKVKGEWIDDLFIVDQHAADEKWNFESLQRETKIRSQRMICPKTLELSATDALVAAEHLEALKDNGFELIIDEEAEISQRVKLISLPVSKDVVFGVRDLEELIHHLRDVPSGSSKAFSIRCSKARSMFASRACRKSVMIGKALNHRQMSNILKHMGSMDQPWNCPHGRPTMRHLVSLGTTNIGSSDSTRQSAHRSIDWDAL